MPVIMQNAAAMAYQKAVSKTRESLAEKPDVPQWLKHFGTHLAEDDSNSRPKNLVESTLHRKTRLFAQSEDTYLKISWFIYDKITSKLWFEVFILLNIVLVGVVTGLDLEYDALNHHSNENINSLSYYVSKCTLAIFTLEVILKLISEGYTPLQYFFDKEDGYFNIFDFLVVIFSYIFISDDNGQTISFLRMLRLLRLLTFVKGVPQLRIIVAGLTLGMKSVAYIVMLLFLIIYMYSILGCILFGENDPAHFGAVSIAMASLFQISTLASWTSIAYVSWYGCEQFMESPFGPSNPSRIDTLTGSFEGFQCTTNKPKPFITGLFFGSYILLTSWVVMSLFVGVISIGMFQSFLEFKEKDAFSAYLNKLDENSLSEEELNEMGQTSMKQKMDRVLDHDGVKSKGYHTHPSAKNYFKYVGYAKKIRDSTLFSLTITFTILLVGIVIGFDTDASLRCYRLEERVDARDYNDDNDVQSNYKENALNQCKHETLYSTVITWTAQTIFTLELFIKVFSEGTHPSRYFTDKENGSWNCLDCFIVLVGFLESSTLKHLFEFFPIVLLRLLRLVRVFRLAKALPRLRSIVEALISGFSSVGWICILILVFNYIVACMFMLLFRKNDPFHFGSVGASMFTVLRIETLDTWDQILYIAMFGCEGYPNGYEFLVQDGNNGLTCNESKAFGWIGAFVLLAVTIVGAYVLPTVLIGVVSIKFDDTNTYFQAMEEQKKNYVVSLEKAKAQMPDFFTNDRIEAINDLFNNLNADGDVALDMPEMSVFFHYAFEYLFGVELTRENGESLFYLLDTSKSTTIGLGEFVSFILILRQMHDASIKDPKLAIKVFGKEIPGSSSSSHHGMDRKTLSGEIDRKSCWDSAMDRVHKESNEMTWDSVLMSINGEDGDTLKERISKIFKDFDSDGSGHLDVDEMREGLTSCGVPLNKPQAKYFFSQLIPIQNINNNNNASTSTSSSSRNISGNHETISADDFIYHVELEVARRIQMKEDEHFEDMKSILARTTSMLNKPINTITKASSSKGGVGSGRSFLDKTVSQKIQKNGNKSLPQQEENVIESGSGGGDGLVKETELIRKIELFEQHAKEINKVLKKLKASRTMKSFYKKYSNNNKYDNDEMYHEREEGDITFSEEDDDDIIEEMKDEGEDFEFLRNSGEGNKNMKKTSNIEMTASNQKVYSPLVNASADAVSVDVENDNGIDFANYIKPKPKVNFVQVKEGGGGNHHYPINTELLHMEGEGAISRDEKGDVMFFQFF